MQTDLALTSNQYSISLVVFFIGYVIFEVPSKYVSFYSELATPKLTTS